MTEREETMTGCGVSITRGAAQCDFTCYMVVMVVMVVMVYGLWFMVTDVLIIYQHCSTQTALLTVSPSSPLFPLFNVGRRHPESHLKLSRMPQQCTKSI